MVDGEAGFLRSYELRLLRFTVSLPPSDLPLESQPIDESQSGTHPHDFLIRSLLSSIEVGDYLGALASDATRVILGDAELDLVDSVDSVESELVSLNQVRVSVFEDSEEDEEEHSCSSVSSSDEDHESVTPPLTQLNGGDWKYCREISCFMFERQWCFIQGSLYPVGSRAGITWMLHSKSSLLFLILKL